MKRIIIAVAAIIVIAGLSACSDPAPSANANDAKASAQILKKAQTAQPVPQFDWSQIRQTLIDAQTAQADATQTTSFFFNLGVVDPVFTCPSIGFPVAGTNQLTNPLQLTDNGDWNHYNGGVVAQIDPNQIYSGDTAATFVLCVGDGGKVYLNHAEETVHAIAGPAKWDYTNHRIVITGAPTFAPKVGK